MPEHGTVAIIGGGLAGLTCAHQLRKASIPTTIFEAGTECGGRVKSLTAEGIPVPLGAVMFSPAYTAFLELLREFGLSPDIERVPLAQSALLIGQRAVALNSLSLARTSSLSLRTKLETRKLWKHLRRIESWQFPDELMRVSLSDYLAGFVGDETKDKIVEPGINAFFQRADQIAAAVGLQMLKALPQVHVLKGGNSRVIDSLTTSLSASVRVHKRVTSAAYENGSWYLHFDSENANFETVVSAVPLDEARALFPEAQITPLEYAAADVLVVKGDFRFPRFRILLDSDCVDSGIHSIKNFGPLQVVHARSRDVALDKFYESSQVLHAQSWKRTLPKVYPGAKLQGIHSGLTGLYLVGDFLLGGRMESAVRSGMAAAGAIEASLKAQNAS